MSNSSKNRATRLLLGPLLLCALLPVAVSTATEASAASTPTSRIEVVLPSKNPLALATAVAAVSNKKSPAFRHFITPRQFAALYGPDPAVLAATVAQLRAAGYQSISVAANGLAVSALASQGTSLAPLARSLPRVLGVVADGTKRAQFSLIAGAHPLAAASPLSKATCATAATLTNARSGPYSPAMITAAYGVSPATASSGAGQRVALYELSNTTMADIVAFDACKHIKPVNNIIKVSGGTTDMSGSLEVLLDAQIVNAVTPGAVTDIYIGPNSFTGSLDTLRQIALDNKDSTVSISWGTCEENSPAAYMAAENLIFSQMALQGQSVFAASGDSGSSTCLGAGDTSLQAIDPGAQPLVTSVGGTSLIDTTCNHVDPNCEVVWNSAPGYAGGGGASAFFGAPNYQSSLHATMRQYPDISSDSDFYTGVVIYDATDFLPIDNSPWLSIGGTSMAAPFQAAFTARSAATCSRRFGLLNPLLYANAALMTDVTVGSNDTGGNGYSSFAATPGFDQASGLGVPKWQLLGPALCAARS